MKPKIWLRRAAQTWLETATDDMGTLDISRIAKRTDLRPETVLFGDLGAYEGITIAEVRDLCGSTAGESKESAVLVDGKAAAHTEGREEGSTSEPVSTVFENIHSKLDHMSALLQESLSHTRAASKMNADDLRLLRSCLDTTILPEEKEVSLTSLLGDETESGESFWDGDTYELQKKVEYMQQFRKMTASRDVVWTDANRTKIKKRFNNLGFPVVAANDLVASLRRFRSLVSVGAILGVEIKRKLSWRGLRQAEAEFYVWSSESLFPFVQLITDMERGGVAIYTKGGTDVRLLTLGSMEAVRIFVRDIVKALPPDAGEDDGEDGYINPDTFTSPSRKRFRLSSSGTSSANPQGGSSSIGRQMAFWSIISNYSNNRGDVANMRELDCFNVEPVH